MSGYEGAQLRRSELDDGIATTLVAVFTALFGPDLAVSQITPGADAPEAGGHVVAAVALSGAVFGTSEVRVSDQLAAHLAGRMFALDRPALADEISDAVGELANVVTGNIKALLPHPCQIGLPVVGGAGTAGVGSGAVVGRAAAWTPEGTVAVLLQFEPQPAAARRQGGTDVAD